MSESVTNVEVEDVLSSIRRLVSDDKRPSVAVISERSNDPLVLTPALRVAGSDEIADNETDNAPAIQAWSDFGASPENKDALTDSEMTDDQWEPDDTGDSDYSGTEAPAMIWDDADPMETVDDDAVPVADTVADFEPQDGFSQSVDDILDEEALRDIVSDIVREELQGALGERITRNVRKLVRREIHRALAAQDLE